MSGHGHLTRMKAETASELIYSQGKGHSRIESILSLENVFRINIKLHAPHITELMISVRPLRAFLKREAY